MATDFVVRRWAAWLTEWDETLCDECVEARGEVTERARNGDPTDFTDDDGQRWYWLEDKTDPEDTCDDCGECAEDHADDEPDQGDYVIDCASNGVSIYGEKFLGYYPSDEQYRFIREHMKAEGYYPSAWQLSDHGNWHLIENLED